MGLGGAISELGSGAEAGEIRLSGQGKYRNAFVIKAFHHWEWRDIGEHLGGVTGIGFLACKHVLLAFGA
jgi:hypothetical protein